jgi:hypothetical protein
MISFNEVALVYESFCDDGGEVLLRPLLCGHVLLENHHLLEPHLLKLLAVL